jgi:hypothetical protein
VHALRKRLGQRRISTEGGGYRFVVEPGELDLDRFERLLAHGRSELASGEAEAAVATFAGGARALARANEVVAPFHVVADRLAPGGIACAVTRADKQPLASQSIGFALYRPFALPLSRSESLRR